MSRDGFDATVNGKIIKSNLGDSKLKTFIYCERSNKDSLKSSFQNQKILKKDLDWFHKTIPEEKHPNEQLSNRTAINYRNLP